VESENAEGIHRLTALDRVGITFLSSQELKWPLVAQQAPSEC